MNRLEIIKRSGKTFKQIQAVISKIVKEQKNLSYLPPNNIARKVYQKIHDPFFLGKYNVRVDEASRLSVEEIRKLLSF